MPFTFKTETHKEELLEKFNKLSGIKKKFDFWEDELENKYIFYLLSTGNDKIKNNSSGSDYYSQFYEFRIIPETSKNYVLYNEIVLQQYIDHVDKLSRRKIVKSLPALIEEFEERLNKIQDKQGYIKQELEKLSKEVFEQSSENSHSFNNNASFFKKAYEQFYFNYEEYDYSQSFFDYNYLVALNNGLVYGQFKRYLEAELFKVVSAPKKTTTSQTWSVTCQMLAVGYFDIIEKLEGVDKTRIADFLARLFNKTPQNIRAKLTDYDELKYSKNKSRKTQIRKDLNDVLDVFKNLGIKSLISKVEEDLRNLEK